MPYHFGSMVLVTSERFHFLPVTPITQEPGLELRETGYLLDGVQFNAKDCKRHGWTHTFVGVKRLAQPFANGDNGAKVFCALR